MGDADLFPGAHTNVAVDLAKVTFFVVVINTYWGGYDLLTGSDDHPETYAATYDKLHLMARDVAALRDRGAHAVGSRDTRGFFAREGNNVVRLPDEHPTKAFGDFIKEMDRRYRATEAQQARRG